MASFPYIGTEGNNVASGAYDLMYGDDGNDVLTSTYSVLGVQIVIFGGAGNDNLNCADGYSSRALIFGDTGNDIIDGGSRSDDLYGGSGDDLITGSSDGDNVYGGSGNDRLFGYWNAFDSIFDGHDYMYGGGGNDKLFGQWGEDDLHGGPGNDILTGGDAKDEFRFDTKLSAKTNVDHIRDFQTNVDKIAIHQSIFKKVLEDQPISPNEFFVGAKAHDADDRIIYQMSTGKLFYDPDGTGKAPQVLFAVLDNKATLSANDIWCLPL